MAPIDCPTNAYRIEKYIPGRGILTIWATTWWDDRDEHGPAGLALDEILSATLPTDLECEDDSSDEEIDVTEAVELWGGRYRVECAVLALAEDVRGAA